MKQINTHSFYKVIVWDLRKEVMYHMGPDVMVDIIDPSIVTIERCKPSSQITPFLSTQYKDISISIELAHKIFICYSF